MKNIYSILSGLGLLAMIPTQKLNAQGLQGIVVEKYYISDAADSTDAADNFATHPLRIGSTTYRVYADLQDGYNFIQMFGSPTHPLEFHTTTAFFNDPNYGVAVYQGTSVNNTKKNTQMIDSYLTVGGVAATKMGVLKTEDTDGTIGNNNGLIANNLPAMGLPVTGTDGVDGLMPGTPVNPNVLGISTELDIFDQTPGADFISTNGAIAALGGVTGVTTSNMVLLGQFTTDGIFSFKLNVQLGTPQVGGSEIYVAENPITGELTDSTLIFVSTPDVPNGITYIQGKNQLSLYPNPSTEFVVLKNNQNHPIGSISVYNATGQLIHQQSTSSASSQIHVADWSAGMYMISVTQEGNQQQLYFIKN
ncbi:MAG: Secretion system C-terminal sorting domain [Bacteroidota bacterium]